MSERLTPASSSGSSSTTAIGQTYTSAFLYQRRGYNNNDNTNGNMQGTSVSFSSTSNIGHDTKNSFGSYNAPTYKFQHMQPPIVDQSSASFASSTSFSSTAPTTSEQKLPLTPQEQSLQSLCKHILKSRLFRGYYHERRYVEAVNGYRDVVALQRGERDLEKVLIDIRQKLMLFYQYAEPPMWVGIAPAAPPSAAAGGGGVLETAVWAELDDIAFGQYWFSVKSIRFREQEILLKLKMVRPVEATQTAATIERKPILHEKAEENDQQPQIALEDFVGIVRQWGESIKVSFYNFLCNDITRDNLIALSRCLGLILVSLISAAFMAVKFLGLFVLRFMYEFTRFTHVATPILLTIVDCFSKIVGGFYILLTMIWKDAVVNRNAPPKNMLQNEASYNRLAYKSITYKSEPRQDQGMFGASRAAEHQQQPEFERKLQ